MQNWTDEQVKYLVSQWDTSIEVHYPQYLRMWREPAENFRCLNEVWNLLDAVKMVDWGSYLVNDHATVLDLGGGTGWLSAYLSKRENVDRIYLVDSNQFFLEKMVPEIVELMEGRQEKIILVRGVFSPLFLEAESVDMVVASSSLHHADNLEDVLREMHRVLKPNGKLMVLNETPYSKYGYLSFVIKQFMVIMKNLITARYRPVSCSISSSGSLYDPYLGDRCYPRWHWVSAIEGSGFRLSEIIDSGLLSCKADSRGIPLTHFVCQKPALK